MSQIVATVKLTDLCEENFVNNDHIVIDVLEIFESGEVVDHGISMVIPKDNVHVGFGILKSAGLQLSVGAFTDHIPDSISEENLEEARSIFGESFAEGVKQVFVKNEELKRDN